VSFIHHRIGLLGVSRNRNQQHVCKKKQCSHNASGTCNALYLPVVWQLEHWKSSGRYRTKEFPPCVSRTWHRVQGIPVCLPESSNRDMVAWSKRVFFQA
jgi:hypothetical protein